MKTAFSLYENSLISFYLTIEKAYA